MSLPVWVHNHAYLLYGRVTPVTPDGRVFWVLTAGTSGAVEPTWPTMAPWQVVDGTVTWGLASAARVNFVAALYAGLTAFKLANPTLLGTISTARYKNLSNATLPAIWIGPRDESDVLTGALRTRTFTGLSVVVVDNAPDNEQAESRMDLLMDGLDDLFTAIFRSVPNAILQQDSVTETSFDDYPGLFGNIITFSPTFITEGRD